MVPSMVIGIPIHHNLISIEIVLKFGSDAPIWLDKLSILYPRDDVIIGQIISINGPMTIKIIPRAILNFRSLLSLFIIIIVT